VAASVLVLTLTAIAAAAAPGGLLAHGSAVGMHAHALAVAHDFGTPKHVTMTVKANPPQRVAWSWVDLCGAPGLIGRGGDGGTGRTPLAVRVTLDPARPCRVTALATLSGKGYLLVQVRRSS